MPVGVILKIVPQPEPAQTLQPSAPKPCCPVEVPIGGLDQPGVGVVASVPSNLCSTFRVPVGVILKTVPLPPAVARISYQYRA